MTDVNGKGTPTLEVRKLTKRFDGVTAVNQVDMEIYEGELLSLIGPNGSGKTTLFNCITGFLRPEEGEVIFKGEPITHARPDKNRFTRHLPYLPECAHSTQSDRVR